MLDAYKIADPVYIDSTYCGMEVTCLYDDVQEDIDKLLESKEDFQTQLMMAEEEDQALKVAAVDKKACVEVRKTFNTFADMVELLPTDVLNAFMKLPQGRQDMVINVLAKSFGFKSWGFRKKLYGCSDKECFRDSGSVKNTIEVLSEELEDKAGTLAIGYAARLEKYLRKTGAMK